MAAAYVDSYVEQLRRLGDLLFMRRNHCPVLIVTGRAAELVEHAAARDRTVVATRSDEPALDLALLHRVFAVEKSANGPRGSAVVLGRSSDNDIAIPEYSISKRHCLFEVDAAGMRVADCGSTNGTIVIVPAASSAESADPPGAAAEEEVGMPRADAAATTPDTSPPRSLSAAVPLLAGQPALLRGGETIILGRFAFLFQTAAGFYSYVQGRKPRS